jgi:hypothetical protein
MSETPGYKIISLTMKKIRPEVYYVSVLMEGKSLKGFMIKHGEFQPAFFFEGSSNYSFLLKTSSEHPENQIYVN